MKTTLYFGNGKTLTITTDRPEKARRVYGAESYIIHERAVA